MNFLSSIPTNNQKIMKKLLLSLAVAVAFSLAGTTVKADDAKNYQVTGPVLEITPDYIVVKKGEANWQLARTKSTKGGDVKVGDKVTVYYTMTATEIEAKPGKAKKADKAADKK